MGKTVCIVGHGPSLLSIQAGSLIDDHDVVVRLKRCQETLKLPKHYGEKVDVVCGSWTIIDMLKLAVPAPEYWAFLDSRHAEVKTADILRAIAKYHPARLCIYRDACKLWNQRYRDRRADIRRHEFQVVDKKRGLSDAKKGHNHMSAGLHALVYAGIRHPGSSVLLAGFDNVLTGEFDWSVTRGPKWKQYPDHNWQTEQQLVHEIANAYKLHLQFLTNSELAVAAEAK